MDPVKCFFSPLRVLMRCRCPRCRNTSRGRWCRQIRGHRCRCCKGRRLGPPEVLLNPYASSCAAAAPLAAAPGAITLAEGAGAAAAARGGGLGSVKCFFSPLRHLLRCRCPRCRNTSRGCRCRCCRKGGEANPVHPYASSCAATAPLAAAPGAVTLGEGAGAAAAARGGDLGPVKCFFSPVQQR